ncbi:hypothetical protein EDD86DRAFT_278567 [Gorgonomyces haynaldii]|nr:hypothetical protein EDD86DRAFT_278567 [Gorgonomyces haynaldii]
MRNFPMSNNLNIPAGVGQPGELTIPVIAGAGGVLLAVLIAAYVYRIKNYRLLFQSIARQASIDTLPEYCPAEQPPDYDLHRAPSYRSMVIQEPPSVLHIDQPIRD